MHIRQYHAFEQSLNFQRYHFLGGSVFHMDWSWKQFFPPTQKNQQKTATFFVLLQRTVWQGDLSHPSHQGVGCFFPLAWMQVGLDRWLDWVGKLILSNGGHFSAFALRPFSSSSFWTPTGAAGFWACFFLFGVGFFFDLPKIFPEKMFVQQSYLQTATLMLFWIKSCCFSFHPLTPPKIEDRYPKWRRVWSQRYIVQGPPFFLEIYSHVPGVHSLFFFFTVGCEVLEWRHFLTCYFFCARLINAIPISHRMCTQFEVRKKYIYKIAYTYLHIHVKSIFTRMCGN